MTHPATVLVADDDRSIRRIMSEALARAGYDVRATGTAAGLWQLVDSGIGDVAVTDVVMPDGDGIDLVARIKERRPDFPIIVVSAQNTLATAVRANETGAYEYLPKPFDINALKLAVDKALKSGTGEEHRDAEQDEELPLIGRSAAMQDVYRTMARVMATDLTVMVTGESGTGKELVARALHDMGRRAGGPFVPVNLAAIPRELIESELFGHEKGAFTGASTRSLGRFEEAQGGTLFLDEIGDMPYEAQTRLLRVLQEGEYRTVGGRTLIHADVRIIAATNRDLRSLVAQGLFREDLFYRLNVVPIRIPPLRERIDDIPDLVTHFLGLAADSGLPAKRIGADALTALKSHHWPGNVRELENLVQRVCALYAGEDVTADVIEKELRGFETVAPGADAGDGNGLSDAIERHLAKYFAAHGDALPPPGLYGRLLKELERPLIVMALSATHGNQIKAAALLGLNRNTLRKKMRDLGLRAVRGVK